MEKHAYQQGDVRLIVVDSEDASGEEIILPDGVIKEGEATGHAHRLVGDYRAMRNGAILYVLAVKACQLIHEEHKAILLPDNTWVKVKEVQEYDHFKEEARRVVD